jgi:hypothetical protein
MTDHRFRRRSAACPQPESLVELKETIFGEQPLEARYFRSEP